MVYIVLFALLLVLPIIIYALLDSTDDYWCETNADDQIIKFKAFKTFYELNPDRWAVYSWENRVKCRTDSGDSVYFRFGRIDYMRYKEYLKNEEKRKKELKDAKDMERVLAAVRSDVRSLQKKAEHEIQRGKLTILTVEELMAEKREKSGVGTESDIFSYNDDGADLIVGCATTEEKQDGRKTCIGI